MIEELISTYGYLAIFIFMTAESALIPIPSEATMVFAGFLAGTARLDFWMVVSIGALGNLVGSLLAYWLGKAMGEDWIRLFIRKWGKWILLHEKDFDLSLKWFKKYGQLIAFGSRLLPVVRTFISLPAGIAKMNLILFSILTFIGSFIWSAFLAFLGLKLGENWEVIHPYFLKFQILIVGLMIAGFVWYLRRHLKNHKNL